MTLLQRLSQSDLPLAKEVHIRIGTVWCLTWVCAHACGAVARESHDTREAGGLDGLGQGHARQHRCQPAC
jgi:hypothetical protein